MKRVIIESPFGSEDSRVVERNLEYLRRCIMDSLKRGEAPFASHGFYPQVLRDTDPMERKLGIEAGFAWQEVSDLVAIYEDYGTTTGMLQGIQNAEKLWIPVERRTIGRNPSKGGREMKFKLVLEGPPGSGKSTFLRWLRIHIPKDRFSLEYVSPHMRKITLKREPFPINRGDEKCSYS